MTTHFDKALDQARAQVERSLRGEAASPAVETLFDEATCTATHIVHDPATRSAAIIDSVMCFDPVSARTSTDQADRIIDHVRSNTLKTEWLLETHPHADHLSAGSYLMDRLGGRTGIGEGISAVQQVFGETFNLGPEVARDGSQFGRLFGDGERFSLGQTQVTVLHVPGHTPTDIAYVIGDAVFAGDTIFMPDAGTARTDFPGGDAGQLYRSIRRLMALPARTRLFLCHDYKSPTRMHYAWETTVAAQREWNIHIRDGIGEEAFVAMRTKRDADLPMPSLILPALQVNIRAGRLPEPEGNGTSFLKLPLNLL